MFSFSSKKPSVHEEQERGKMIRRGLDREEIYGIECSFISKKVSIEHVD